MNRLNDIVNLSVNSMNCSQAFEQIFHQENDSVAFCPYRICPIGAHSDHNFGKITGLAIDKGIYMAYKPEEACRPYRWPCYR